MQEFFFPSLNCKLCTLLFWAAVWKAGGVLNTMLEVFAAVPGLFPFSGSRKKLIGKEKC